MSSGWDDPRQTTENQVHRYLPSGQRMTTVEENLSFQQSVRTWGEAILQHMFPGALVFVFAGTRMSEWVSTAMQMVGFEHWETIIWIHAQGFPKAMDIGKQVDKKNGNEREVIGRNPNSRESSDPNNTVYQSGTGGKMDFISIGTSGWDGYKTPALKPAWEPILCFRAPRQGMTYAELALKFGTGALNVVGGRLASSAKKWDSPKAEVWHESAPGGQHFIDNPLGRYPANLIFDEEAAKLLDQQSGRDASRFFFVAKASRRERDAGCKELPVIRSGTSNGAQTHGEGYDRRQDIGLNRVIPRKNDHPCVKPLALTRYLATLLLPPASVAPRRLFVPFAGTGSEVIGAMQAGSPIVPGGRWDEIVGIEQDAHYCEIARRRIEHWRKLLPSATAAH
jgi:site-specific DNA-methyltransferase (adenine-specific)